MFKSSKVLSTVLVFAFVSFVSASAAFAEASNSERSVTGFFKRLFNYPVKATSEAAGTTSKALHNTGEKVVAKTGENTAAIVHGDVAKTGNLVVDPVVGAAETTGQALSETVQIPVKATEEDAAK